MPQSRKLVKSYPLSEPSRVASIEAAVMGPDPAVVYSTDGAITDLGLGVIAKSSVAAMTLDQPIFGPYAAGGQDGAVLDLIDVSGHAHTVTTALLGIDGNAHIATFDGTLYSNCRLLAYSGVWVAITLNGVTLS